MFDWIAALTQTFDERFLYKSGTICAFLFDFANGKYPKFICIYLISIDITNIAIW